VEGKKGAASPLAAGKFIGISNNYPLKFNAFSTKSTKKQGKFAPALPTSRNND